jgi:carbonic anhydrase/acetyltransferase-like protein (isoleucine patch superfamily)
MIRAFRGVLPRIAASAYVDPSAQVIGDVEIGERSSIWPNVPVRGDVHSVRIGAETNGQFGKNAANYIRYRHEYLEPES